MSMMEPVSNGHAPVAEPQSFNYCQPAWGSSMDGSGKMMDAVPNGVMEMASQPVPSGSLQQAFADSSGAQPSMDGHTQLSSHAAPNELQQQPAPDNHAQLSSMQQPSVSQGYQTNASLESVFASKDTGVNGVPDPAAHSQPVYQSGYLMGQQQDRTTSEMLQILVTAPSDQSIGMPQHTGTGVPQQPDLRSSGIAMALAGVDSAGTVQMADGSQGMQTPPGVSALPNHGMSQSVAMGAAEPMPTAPASGSYLSREMSHQAAAATTQHQMNQQAAMAAHGQQAAQIQQQQQQAVAVHQNQLLQAQAAHAQAASQMSSCSTSAPMMHRGQQQQQQQQQPYQQSVQPQDMHMVGQVAPPQQGSMAAAVQQQQVQQQQQQQQQQQTAAIIQLAQQQHHDVSAARAQQEAVMAQAQMQAQVHQAAAQSAPSMSMAQAHQAAAQQATAQAHQAANSASQLAAVESQVSATLNRLTTAAAAPMVGSQEVGQQQPSMQGVNPMPPSQGGGPAAAAAAASPANTLGDSYSGGSMQQPHSMLTANPSVNSLQQAGQPLPSPMPGMMTQQPAQPAPAMQLHRPMSGSLPVGPQADQQQAAAAVVVQQQQHAAEQHAQAAAQAQAQIQSSQQHQLASQQAAMAVMQQAGGHAGPDMQQAVAVAAVAAAANQQQRQQMVAANMQAAVVAQQGSATQGAAGPPLQIPPQAAAAVAQQQQQQQQMMAAAVQCNAAAAAMGLPGVGMPGGLAAAPPEMMATPARTEGMPPPTAQGAMAPEMVAMVNAAGVGAGILTADGMQAVAPAMVAAGVRPGLCMPVPSHRGVQWDPAAGAWQAVFMEGEITKNLGHFQTEQEAAMAWDHEVRAVYGPNPQHLNFPQAMDSQAAAAAAAAAAVAAAAAAAAAAEPPPESRPPSPRAEPYRSSKFRGVSRGRGKKKWRAMIQHQKKQIHVGYYDSGLEAARAYDREAVKLLGPDAVTNFPISDYYPELTEQGKQGLPGEGPAVGNEQDYDYDEYDDDEDDDAEGGAAAAAALGEARGDRCEDVKPSLEAEAARQRLSAPDGGHATAAPLSYAAPEAGPVGAPNRPVPPLLSRDPSPQRGPVPRVSNTSSGTPCSSIPPAPTMDAAVPRSQKTVEQLLRESGRSELWGVKQEGDNWRAQITIDLGTYPNAAEAAAAHDRAATWTLGVTANTNLAKGSELVSLPAGGQPSTTSALPPRPDAPESTPQSGGEPAQKRAKMTEYHGITTKDGGETWYAVMRVQGQQKEYGPFNCEKDAARCYDRCSALLWGLQARTNFPLIDVLCTVPEAPGLVEHIVRTYNTNRDKQARNAELARAAAEGAAPQAPAQGAMPLDAAPAVLSQATADPPPSTRPAKRTEVKQEQDQ